MTRVLCLDTGVWIPYLVPEVYQAQATTLVAEALSLNIRLVAPAFGWAEVGSVLRKKTWMGVITKEEAVGFFEDFCELPKFFIRNIKYIFLDYSNKLQPSCTKYNFHADWTPT